MTTDNNKTLAINDNDSDTTKGSKVGAQFGHALAGSIDEVGNGAATIVSVAGHTVFGAVGRLVGSGAGGAVQGVKALFTSNLSDEELEEKHSRRMKKLEMAERERTLRAEYKAKRQAIKNQRKLNALLAKAGTLATESDEE